MAREPSVRDNDARHRQRELNTRVRALLRIADMHWRDFDSRRSYEWKVNFALWTSLGALAGLLLRSEGGISDQMGVVASGVVAVIYLVYWVVWSVGTWRRNYHDFQDAHREINSVREIIKNNPNLDRQEDRRIAELPIPRYSTFDIFLIWLDWSRRAQLIITLLFSGLVIAAIWF